MLEAATGTLVVEVRSFSTHLRYRDRVRVSADPVPDAIEIGPVAAESLPDYLRPTVPAPSASELGRDFERLHPREMVYASVTAVSNGRRLRAGLTAKVTDMTFAHGSVDAKVGTNFHGNPLDLDHVALFDVTDHKLALWVGSAGRGTLVLKAGNVERKISISATEHAKVASVDILDCVEGVTGPTTCRKSGAPAVKCRVGSVVFARALVTVEDSTGRYAPRPDATWPVEVEGSDLRALVPLDAPDNGYLVQIGADISEHAWRFKCNEAGKATLKIHDGLVDVTPKRLVRVLP